MPARALALAALLAAVPGVAGLAPFSPQAEGDDHLGCDSLAPFEPEGCSDCCERFRGEVQPEVHLEGFVGRVDLKLVGDDGHLRYRCWSLLVPVDGATAACTGPTEHGDVERGEMLRLTCRAYPTTGPGLPASVGPVGPYSCEATFD